MNISKIELKYVSLPLKNPFKNSKATMHKKDTFIILIHDINGRIGFGETVAFETPWYTEETLQTTFYMMENHLIPLLQTYALKHPRELKDIFKQIKRNYMAKAGIEQAIWDLYAKQLNKSLSSLFKGTRSKIEAGVSIGIETSIESLFKKIDDAKDKNYKRIKIKIDKGWDIEILQEIRNIYPKLPLMVDANSAYEISDINHLKKLDSFHLMMIEQPFGQEDFLEHAHLQRELETPICLDESIHSVSDVKIALELGSCKVINVKIGRVGGWTNAVEIHNLCERERIECWVGGMFESGIGRAHNIALSSLPQFSLPDDIQSSSHYWYEDLIEPEIIVDNGLIEVPNKAGIGFQVDLTILEKYTNHTNIYYL